MTNEPIRTQIARQFERIKSVETALVNGAHYADDPECHPCYPTLVAARQILEAEFERLSLLPAVDGWSAGIEAAAKVATERGDQLRKMLRSSGNFHSSTWHSMIRTADEILEAIRALRPSAPASVAGSGEDRSISDSDFAWRVPRHATDEMISAGLYHCSHDMTSDDLFTAWHYMVDAAIRDNDAPDPLAAPASDGLRASFRPMEQWDQRNETVLLLVDYTAGGEHALDDALVAITIGHNNDHNVGEGEGQGWQFAGWCWSHDHYTQGVGVPIGWMPLPHYMAREHEAALDQPQSGEGGE